MTAQYRVTPALLILLPVAPHLLRVNQLTKRYGNRPGLDNVSFTLAPGEVLGVVGRRGAGKSTLLYLLAGLHPTTTGTFYFREQPLRRHNLHQAHRYGIELVPQYPLLAEQLDVLANIFLGREIGWFRPDLNRMFQRAQQVLADLDLPPTLLTLRTRELTDEQRQIVSIARALCFDPIRPPALILLDDALTSLSFQRQEKLLELIKSLALQGVAFIITSDNLKHLFTVTHRIMVLYEGRLIADRHIHETTPREVVELMVGTTQHEQVTPIIWALESFHQAQERAEELNRIQATLRESLEAQGSLNQQLLGRMRAQVDALNQLTTALQATQRRLLTEREEERKSLARELHDQVIQDLLSFNYRLEELEEDEALEARRDELAALRAEVRQIVSDLRQLCSDLRPPTIDSHGLTAALRSHTQEWAEINGVRLTLELQPDLGRLPESVELSIFRIVQEALNNIRRHARARAVTVALQRTAQANLVLRLSDDGQGSPEPIDLGTLSAQKHFGLLGISERVALLSGILRIDSRAGGGTTLQVEIPSPSPMV